MVLPLEQDDIQIIGNKIIYSRCGSTRLNIGPLWSEGYDSISVDPNLEDISYYQRYGQTDVYYIDYSNKDTGPIAVPIMNSQGKSVELAYYKKLSDSFHGVYQFLSSKKMVIIQFAK